MFMNVFNFHYDLFNELDKKKKLLINIYLFGNKFLFIIIMNSQLTVTEQANDITLVNQLNVSLDDATKLLISNIVGIFQLHSHFDDIDEEIFVLFYYIIENKLENIFEQYIQEKIPFLSRDSNKHDCK